MSEKGDAMTQVRIWPDLVEKLKALRQKGRYPLSLTDLANMAIRDGLPIIEKGLVKKERAK